MTTHEQLSGPRKRRTLTNMSQIPCFVSFLDEQGRERITVCLEPGQSMTVPGSNVSAWTVEGTAQLVFRAEA